MSAPNVLQEWPPSRWDDYMAGFTEGYTQGIDRGRQLADAEAAARHRAAAEVALNVSRAPVVDRAEAAARRARIDARFTGEGGAA